MDTTYVERRRPALGRGFGWICTLLGFGLMLLGGGDARRVISALAWPTVSGEVRSAQVSTDTVGVNIGKWRNSPVIAPRFHVTYAYRVGGADYLGRQIDRLPVAHRDARADLERYPAGTIVSVHYNPRSPAEAVLEAQWPLRSIMTGIAGAGLLLVGRTLSRKPKAMRTLPDTR